MKPKIAPTSPKYALEHPVEDLYRRPDAQSINQPAPRSRWLPTIFISVVFGLLAGTAGMVTLNSLYQFNAQWPIWGWLGLSNTQKPEREVVIRESGSVDQLDQLRQSAYDHVVPTLVSLYRISQETANVQPLRLDQTAAWLGTGVIISSDGLMALDRTIFEQTDQSVVAVSSEGQPQVISLLSSDPASRLGLAKLADGNYPIIAFAVAAKLTIGQELYELAAHRLAGAPRLSPVNLSAISRQPADQIGQAQSSEAMSDYYLTAPETIHPASGDAVVDIDGALVGLRLGDDQRLLPVDMLRSALKNYEKFKKIERPALGVNYLDLSTAIGLPLSVTGGRTEGALLSANTANGQPAVRPGSPAEAAGLSADDLIIKINNEPITARSSLSRLIQTAVALDEISIRLIRQGAEQELKVSLGKQ